jgi:hypothetical protein
LPDASLEDDSSPTAATATASLSLGIAPLLNPNPATSPFLQAAMSSQATSELNALAQAPVADGKYGDGGHKLSSVGGQQHLLSHLLRRNSDTSGVESSLLLDEDQQGDAYEQVRFRLHGCCMGVSELLI